MALANEIMGSRLIFERSSSLASPFQSRFSIKKRTQRTQFSINPFDPRPMRAVNSSGVVAAISEDMVKTLRISTVGRKQEKEEEEEKSVKFKVRAVATVRNKNKEDFKDTLVKHLDAFTDQIGRNVVLELISTQVDPKTNEPKKSKAAVLKDWSKKSKLKAERVHYTAEFTVDSAFGSPGAITVTNKHQKEFFLESITIEGFACGPVHFPCNSWVQSQKDHPSKRIFFTNQPYLPSETPSGLKTLREKELENLRGNGKGERKLSDRIYDFDVYNDIGNPDISRELARPTFGGPKFPYPRRCRTGRPSTDTDMMSERRVEKPLPMYVPKDEQFEESKQNTFAACRLKAVLHNLIPSLKASILAEDFANFGEIDSLYKEGLLLKLGFQDDMFKKFPLPKIVTTLQKSSEGLLRYDTLPLVEKIRSQISTWTARALSFAGRLQLLSSVVFSLINFWIAAFRLPKACIREIDKLCSAFLWSGPSLNPRKAKVAWEEVCTPKSEGGLGLRSIAEANKVSMLKLIWRLLSAKGSLWVDWVQTNLIRRGSFWAVKNNTSSGSWIWRKLLKYRDKAKEFHRVEVKNGETTSFWFDSWSSLGCITEKLGDRGYIDLGIPKSATVGEVMAMQRRRKHRSALLNQVEEEIKKQRLVSRVGEEDIALWRGTKDNYRKKFITRETWMQTRNARPTMEGYQGIWFSHSTPRYSFITWLVAKNRVATGDRMLMWNQHVNTSCVLCNDPMETRDHLFFSCSYSRQVWEEVAGGILRNRFSTDWREILKHTCDKKTDKTNVFILRYVFQNTIHAVWGERNSRRHGEQPSQVEKLVHMIDKNVRNRLSTIRSGGDFKYEGGLRLWFGSRQTQV